MFLGNGYHQNSFFKVVNENSNSVNDKQIVVNGQIQLIVEQKKVPSILKRTTSVIKSPPSIVIPAESTKGGKIAISPMQLPKYNGAPDVQVKVCISNLVRTIIDNNVRPILYIQAVVISVS